MPTNINILYARKHLSKHFTTVSRPQIYGTDGWLLMTDGPKRSILISCAGYDSGEEWVHASIAGERETPSYEELAELHKAVFRNGFSYQCFVPPEQHYNYHEHALHLWGRLDGKPVLPEFFKILGSI